MGMQAGNEPDPTVAILSAEASDGLTLAQRQIIAAPPEGEIVVGGVAGSGKTLAAVHRAVALCAQTPPRRNEPAVLLLCFNRTLAARVRRLLVPFPRSITGRIAVRTLHQWCAPYVRREFPDYRVVDEGERLAVVMAALHEARIGLGEHDLFAREASFWLEEIRLIKGGGLRDETDYLAHQRANSGALAPADYRLIHGVAATYDRLLRAGRRLDFDDFAPIALEALASQRQPRRIDHVIVDEAQDLSAVQITLCRCLARRSLLLVADQDQAIYRVTRLPATLPAPADYAVTLPESLRAPAAILAYARRLLPAPESVALPARQGEPPVYRHFRWCEDEAAFIAETVAALLAEGLPPEEIAVLVRLHELEPPLAAALAERGAPAGVTLETIHAAKGREFRAVLVAGLVEGVLPRLMPDLDRVAAAQELELARRLLYVAMTRAGERLWLTSSEGPPSRLLAAMGLPAPGEPGALP